MQSIGRILIIDVSSWITGMGAGGRKGGWGEGGGREGRMGGGVGGGKGGGRPFIIASVSSHQCGLVVFAYCRCIFFP